MVLEGDNLSVPSSMEAEKCKDGWIDILTSLSVKFTDEFVTNLNRYWLSVVKKQGGKITETFSREILDIIENKPSATVSKSGKLSMPASIPEPDHRKTPCLYKLATTITNILYFTPNAPPTKMISTNGF